MCFSAGRASDPLLVDLWPGKAPGETAASGEEKLTGDVGSRRLTDVSKPTLTIYRPDKDKDTGTAVIIAPGGAYRFLAWDHEGEQVQGERGSHGRCSVAPGPVASDRYQRASRPGPRRRSGPRFPLL